jgi:3-deoxy-D-manno-octulosonic-acid transferase
VLSLYRVAARLGHRLPLPQGTLRASLAGRRAAAARWTSWATEHRTTGPLVWAHAPSVGEQQALEPVLRRLARARPDTTIILTHTSPSILHTAVPEGVCHRDFLPRDEPESTRRALDALDPALIVFGRGDLWPELMHQVARRRIPVAVVGGTVRPRSLRLRRVPRALLHRTSRGVTWLGAATDGDAARWVALGVPAERIQVTGDPRHDRLLERIADPRPATAVRTWAGADPVLVAGSVEPSDDEALIGALSLAHRSGSPLRAVIVPHDPSEQRVAVLVRRLAEHGLSASPWPVPASTPALPDPSAVVTTTHGLLADLYLAADVAYVGGGFRPGRLHAIAEPAAVGVPMIVGPRWEGVVDTGPMVASGGAIAIANDRGRGLADVIVRLVRDPAERTWRGLAARGTLSAGAAQTSAGALLRYLEQ